jgi:alkanesulfonate monooxygenase
MTRRFSVRWFLPMSTDTAYVGTYPENGQEPTLEHLTAIARTAQEAGCTGMLVPTAYVNALDPVAVAAAVLGGTDRISLLLAVRQNQYHPVQAAVMFASLATLFPGRIEINVVTGGWGEDAWLGDDLPREQRTHRLAEWLDLFTTVLRAEDKTSFDGEYYHSHGALRTAAARVPIALSGSSPAAIAALLRHGDDYLTFAAPVGKTQTEVERIRDAAVEAGSPPRTRLPRTIVRAHLVVRETEDEARAAAEALLSRADPRVLATVRRQSNGAGSQRTAQSELAAAGDLWIGPNLWAGVGTARYGASLSLVGDPGQIADRLAEYAAAGVDGFILSGYPKLEECERYARLLAPVLRERNLLEPPRDAS